MDELSIPHDMGFLRDATNLTDEQLLDMGKQYTFLDRDPSLNDRQRQEVDKILARIGFELLMRKKEIA